MEDERDICDTLVSYLCDKSSGNECAFARTMEDARRKIDENVYDVMILDLIINGQNSSELIDRARKRYGGNRPVVILISAMPGAKQISEVNHCEFFMGKPFDLETIDDIIFVKCKKRFDELTHLR